MVGRLRNDRLIVYGTETAREFPALLDSLNRAAKFDLKSRGDGYGPSDQSSFYAVQLPVLHFFTDLHEDYHRTTDDAGKLDLTGMQRVAEFATNVVRALAERPARPTYVAQAAPQPQAAPSGQTRASGYGAYLGTVPDMAGDVTGVKLSGVRAGSPAEKAGLQRDDVITRIGEAEVNDLQGMTDALRTHKPGDVVPITVQRNGQPVTLSVTLGTRGG
jgi:C-terminal processing protease CtpA/Prc